MRVVTLARGKVCFKLFYGLGCSEKAVPVPMSLRSESATPDSRYSANDPGSQFYSRNFLSAPFLDAFGQEGGVLRWRTDKGGEIASWLLTGMAAATEIVRKVCNL
jgi:hypothetical protein